MPIINKGLDRRSEAYAAFGRFSFIRRNTYAGTARAPPHGLKRENIINEMRYEI